MKTVEDFNIGMARWEELGTQMSALSREQFKIQTDMKTFLATNLSWKVKEKVLANLEIFEPYKYKSNRAHEILDQWSSFGKDSLISAVTSTHVSYQTYVGGGDYENHSVALSWFFDTNLINQHFQRILETIHDYLNKETEAQAKERESWERNEYERLKKKFENVNT